MEKEKVVGLLNEMFTELVISFGVLAARHRVEDEAIWDVVKHFDIIYQRSRGKAEVSTKKGATKPQENRMKPHPGIMHLLEKLRGEKARLRNG